MTKAELIKALEPFPDDLEVIIYDDNSEEGGVASGVRLETEETKDYYKCDHPFKYDERVMETKKAINIYT